MIHVSMGISMVATFSLSDHKWPNGGHFSSPNCINWPKIANNLETVRNMIPKCIMDARKPPIGCPGASTVLTPGVPNPQKWGGGVKNQKKIDFTQNDFGGVNNTYVKTRFPRQTPSVTLHNPSTS